MIKAEQWVDILAFAGVERGWAQKWSPHFEAEVTEKAFSAGFSELDDFLGQVLHESAMLERLEENLNYSVDALLSKFGRHRISEADARKFGRITGTQRANQVAIANTLYGGKWGASNLGNTQPGDGWMFRGSGPIQVTGRGNFAALEKATGLPLVKNPDLLRRPGRDALRVCIAWWEGNVPDSVMGDIKKVTKEVNGGHFGLDHRAALTEKIRAAIC